MKRTLLYYLSQSDDNLLPDDSQVSNIVDKDWYNAVKPFFNDLIWEYYSDRVVFVDQRFQLDAADEEIIANIKRSFATLLKTKNYEFEKLYETTLLEYNPIWNVDGVTGTIHEYTTDDTDTLTHSGTDRTKNTGNDDTQHRGTIDLDKSGDDTLTHSGDVTVDHTIDEDTNVYDTTYDSAATTPPGEFLKEHTNFASDTDQDKTTYDNTDTTTYDTNEKTTYMNNDKTIYDSQNETLYGHVETNTRKDFHQDLDLNIRQGNIGVTMTQQMINAERQVAAYDFYKKVVHDCVNSCTYAVE